MKDNLEKVFKDKLDQFEAPYDASAWESMNSRLDAKQGIGGNSLFKWIAGSAAILAVVAVSTYFLMKEEVNNSNEQAKIAEQSESLENDSDANSFVETETIEKKSISNNTGTDENSQVNIETQENDNGEFVENTPNVVLPEAKEASSEDFKSGENHISNAETPENVQSNNDGSSAKPKYNFIAGKLINDKVCKGESIVIRNSGGKNDIIKLQIENDVFSLKKANAHEFKPEHSGSILYLDGKNNVIGKEEYIVFEVPNPDFNMKANIFEDGLPIAKCETYGDYESVVWTFGKENHEIKGRKATHHFFKKGEHDVTLTVTDYNGCKNSKTKKVRIEDNYNLMAVDAFKPNGTDPRNKIFMPFALTQRDVNFTLTIVDPRDNSVIFSTQDATKGWDGIDQRTGSITPSETVYIWKAQLENPLPNERQVYAGTVVHN